MSIDNKHLFLIKNSFKSGIKNILNMIKRYLSEHRCSRGQQDKTPATII